MSVSTERVIATSKSATCDAAAPYLRLDHLGEFIAVNIYRAQLCVCRFRCPPLLPQLQEFLAHEQQHFLRFDLELQGRGLRRCRGFALLGVFGTLAGFGAGLMGRQAVLACTAAVETVVLRHLSVQLTKLRACGDRRAIATIESIVADEIQHRDVGAAGEGAVYRCVHAVVSAGTSAIIALGLRL